MRRSRAQPQPLHARLRRCRKNPPNAQTVTAAVMVSESRVVVPAFRHLRSPHS